MFKEYNGFLNALRNYEMISTLINKINELTYLNFLIQQNY